MGADNPELIYNTDMIKNCIICNEEFDAMNSAKTCSLNCSRENESVYNKRYSEEHREESSIRSKQHYEKNRDKVLARSKRRYEKNRDEVLAQHKLYYAEHREEFATRQKLYRTEHLADYAANSAHRRSSVVLATPALTDEESSSIEGFYEEAQGLSKTSGEDYHVDHKIPLSRGGKHHPDNLQVIPGWMNCAKHNKLPSEFIELCPEYGAYYEEKTQ